MSSIALVNDIPEQWKIGFFFLALGEFALCQLEAGAPRERLATLEDDFGKNEHPDIYGLFLVLVVAFDLTDIQVDRFPYRLVLIECAGGVVERLGVDRALEQTRRG